MICHHQKCIFVHVPKTAGQSVEHVFLNLLGLSWDARAPLLLRPNDRPELGPPRLAHLKAADYVRCKYLPREMFETYFKFSFVRNPWDRMVSIYKYIDSEKKYEFKAFLMNIFKDSIWSEQNWFVCPQAEYLFDTDGKSLMDFIGRFEDLQNDFQQICLELGLGKISLPHVNKAVSGAGRPYQDYYDEESRQVVEELYGKDIELFDYKFEQT